MDEQFKDLAYPAENYNEAARLRHKHDNAEVLDKFGESDGHPTFDGRPIAPASSVDLMFFAVENGNPVATHTAPTAPQTIMPITYFSANPGIWHDILTFTIGDDLRGTEFEFIPGNSFTAKFWVQSDMERSNAQFRLNATDIQTGTQLATGTISVDLGATGVSSPVLITGIYTTPAVVLAENVRMTLQAISPLFGIQVGLVSNPPNEISYIARLISGTATPSPITDDEIKTLRNLHLYIPAGIVRSTFYVDGTIGVDAYDYGISVSKPWKTIQYAINRLQERPQRNEYTLNVASGIYKESITITNLAVTIIGNRNNPLDVVVGQALTGNTFYAYRGTVLSLQGLHIKHCATPLTSASQYRTTYAFKQSVLDLLDCIIESNDQYIHDVSSAYNSTITINNVMFIGERRYCVLSSSYGGFLNVASESFIENSMTVTSGLILVFKAGAMTLSTPLTKRAGIITGTKYRVSEQGRLANSANLPVTTEDGTMVTGGSVS